MKADDVALAIDVLAAHNRLMAINLNQRYLGSDLELRTLKTLSELRTLQKRMTEKNRSDYIGPEL